MINSNEFYFNLLFIYHGGHFLDLNCYFFYFYHCLQCKFSSQKQLYSVAWHFGKGNPGWGQSESFRCLWWISLQIGLRTSGLRQNPQSSITALGSECNQLLSEFADESTMWLFSLRPHCQECTYTFPDYNRFKETAATQCYLSKGKDLLCLLHWKHGTDYLALTYSWV